MYTPIYKAVKKPPLGRISAVSKSIVVNFSWDLKIKTVNQYMSSQCISLDWKLHRILFKLKEAKNSKPFN